MIDDYITTISLALTSTYFVYSALILKLWWPEVYRTYNSGEFNKPSTHLARGIFVGFSASLIDNAFWGFTWMLVLFDHPWGVPLMLSGSLGNIFFRQIGGLYSAHEHLLAVSKISENSVNVYRWSLAGWSSGAVVLVLLLVSQ